MAEIRWFVTTQAMREVACPRCHSLAGVVCRQPSGRPYDGTHVERCTWYRETIGDAEFARRHVVRQLPLWDEEE